MAAQASGVATLIDVLQNIGPDGKAYKIAEVLTQNQEILEDVVWVEGNMTDGHKDAVRTSVPEPSFRAFNAGVPLTKGGSSTIEETCALLEDFSRVDRELAMRHVAGVDAYRTQEAIPHMQGMGNKMARSLFYANQTTNPLEFTGLAPRFNTLNTTTSEAAGQVIDAGGTGADLRSVWLVGWSPQTVFGIYPRGTQAGLSHEDMTNAENGKTLYDASGLPFVGFEDHWLWRCGLMVKDWRYVVRIANINLADLTLDASTGPDLQDLMIQAAELIESYNGVRAAWYVPRSVRAYFRRQIQQKVNRNLSWSDQKGFSGQRVLMFDEAPVRRTDALNTSEARVTT
jgi:hypothetical protein